MPGVPSRTADSGRRARLCCALSRDAPPRAVWYAATTGCCVELELQAGPTGAARAAARSRAVATISAFLARHAPWRAAHHSRYPEPAPSDPATGATNSPGRRPSRGHRERQGSRSLRLSLGNRISATIGPEREVRVQPTSASQTLFHDGIQITDD